MKILGLQITNLRKIKAFNYEFKESGLIQIRGKNRAGKSSIIKAIEMLLRGKKYQPGDVVTHGEDKAEIIANLGEYTIRKTVSKTGNETLKITNKDGLQVATKPQDFLSTLVNELSFDPKYFLDKDANKKLRYLMDFLNLDFADIDAEIKKLTEERLYIGRRVKEFGDLEKPEEVKEEDLTALTAERDDLLKFNQELQDNKDKIDALDIRISERAGELTELEEKVKAKKDQLKKLRESRAKGQEIVSGKEPKPLDDIDERIAKVSETNKKAALFTKWEENDKSKKEKEKEYSDLTVKINEQKKKKEDKLKAVEMPVDGLEITEEGLFYKGTFCDNWSDSEAMDISFKLAIARNPKLRAVLIDRGEAYDSDGLEMLEKWANENDIQAFITIVDSAEGEDKIDDAIYIHDGELVE